MGVEVILGGGILDILATSQALGPVGGLTHLHISAGCLGGSRYNPQCAGGWRPESLNSEVTTVQSGAPDYER